MQTSTLNIFDFNNYRSFLKRSLADCSPSRGAHTRLAKAMGCQTAFLSQVLAGKVNLSLEHATKVQPFLGISAKEGHFFMLLLQKERAGCAALKEYFGQQMKTLLSERQEIQERLQVTMHRPTLSFADQVNYYQSWVPSAVHVALMLAEQQDCHTLAQHIGISAGEAKIILDFLLQCGLAKQEGRFFSATQKRLHLSKDSPLIAKHHTNWRLKMISSMESQEHDLHKQDLHYSGVFTLSRTDMAKIREILLLSLEKAEPIIQESKEEALAALCLDWVEL